MWTWKFFFWKIWKSFIFTEFSIFILGYVEEIFQTYMNASKDELKDANTELYEKTPAAMNSMLEKQPRAEALLKRQQRSKMVVTDVPPTTPGTLHHFTAVHHQFIITVFIDNLCQNLLIWTMFFYCHPFTNVSTTTRICKVKSPFFLPHQFLRSQKLLDSSLRGERKPPENAGSASSLWRATRMLWIVHAIRDKNRSTLNKRF